MLKKDGKPKAQEVDPVKNPKDIQRIRQYLKGKENKRDYCLWVVGTNFLLRAGDLLRLKWSDILKNENNFKTYVRTQEYILHLGARHLYAFLAKTFFQLTYKIYSYH